jgi:predicted nucleotidyltransferase
MRGAGEEGWAMTLRALLQEKREDILRLCAKYGAHNVRVFGSAVRGEDRPDSDVDFLVDFEPGRSLLDQIALALELGQLLGRKADVVTDSGLYWLLRRRILKEARPL